MKNAKTGKRVLATIVAAGILTLGVSAFAAEAMTPAKVAASVTEKSLEFVQAERAKGKTYGTVAKEFNKLEEFKSLSLAQKKIILQQQVTAGTITQDQANATIKTLEDAQAACNGTATGTARIGRTDGIGFGSGSGLKDGTGASTGYGRSGNRAGNGTGVGTGRGTGMGVHRRLA